MTAADVLNPAAAAALAASLMADQPTLSDSWGNVLQGWAAGAHQQQHQGHRLCKRKVGSIMMMCVNECGCHIGHAASTSRPTLMRPHPTRSRLLACHKQSTDFDVQGYLFGLSTLVSIMEAF